MSPCILRRSLRFAPLTAVLIGAGAFASLAWKPVAVVAPTPLAVDESPIHDHMEEMNAAMRFFLKTGVSAENRAQGLEWIAKFQAGVVAAKVHEPESAAKVEAARKAEFVTGFRKMLVDVLATSCRLETAILDGKYEEANRIAREELTKLKKDGHDKYEEED